MACPGQELGQSGAHRRLAQRVDRGCRPGPNRSNVGDEADRMVERAAGMVGLRKAPDRRRRRPVSAGKFTGEAAEREREGFGSGHGFGQAEVAVAKEVELTRADQKVRCRNRCVVGVRACRDTERPIADHLPDCPAVLFAAAPATRIATATATGTGTATATRIAAETATAGIAAAP